MAKKMVDYKDHVLDAVRAFDERRILLVSQGNEGLPNVMAIGGGAIGILWHKPIFIVYIRPTRFTYKLIEETGEFTLNIATPSLKDVVNYCGSVSGRNHDKFKEKQLTAVPSINVKPPIVKECILHFECRTVCKNDVVASALTADLIRESYSGGSQENYHRIYFGEILACRYES